jgi:hypothetical protein
LGLFLVDKFCDFHDDFFFKSFSSNFCMGRGWGGGNRPFLISNLKKQKIKQTRA